MVVINYTVEEWVEDDPEKMKNIPPLEECIDRIPINCHKQTIGVFLSGLLLGGGTFVTVSRYRTMREMDFTTMLWCAGILGLIVGIDEFLGRKERGYIAIYPEMMVFYWYDKEKKRIRVWDYSYWENVVQYSKRENAIWLDSVDNYPACPQFKMKKLKPYLEQYAPHAKVITFDVDKYWDKKFENGWKKHNAEYKRQIKGYNEKKKALIEEARCQAREDQENKDKE